MTILSSYVLNDRASKYMLTASSILFILATVHSTLKVQFGYFKFLPLPPQNVHVFLYLLEHMKCGGHSPRWPAKAFIF